MRKLIQFAALTAYPVGAFDWTAAALVLIFVLLHFKLRKPKTLYR